MKTAISIDTGETLEFSTTEELLTFFGAEYGPTYEEMPNVSYVFIDPFQYEIRDRRVLMCYDTLEEANAAHYDSRMDI